MLDPASIERLAAFPEKNDPLLNVALAEEGGGDVLLCLARCTHLGAEALDIIAGRVAREASSLTSGDEEPKTPVAPELERELIGHPNTPRAARDAILSLHRHESFFVLTAAAHPNATPFALQAGASWPAASPLHDRPWLLLMEATGAALLAPEWADDNEALREAAASVAKDAALLRRLAADPSRRVRRAVASNRHAGELRREMAARDPAVEVRARAARPALEVEGAAAVRFAVALHAMEQGGSLSGDVRDALLSAGASLDEEGAFLGARYLGSGELRSLVSQATAADADPLSQRGTGVAVGLGLRCATSTSESDGASLTNEIVHLTMRLPSAGTSLTGKARAAHWIAESLGRSGIVGQADLAREIVPRTLASDRMVLLRWAASARASLSSVCNEDARSLTPLPLAVVELCWRDPAVGDEAVVALCSRLAPTARSERELPEDELDLAPLRRPLAVLERAVLAALPHAPPSPRAALAAIALDPRRCRYILSAMPTWKGTLTGARLARVLRSHAGALSAAARSSSAPPAGGTARVASDARWTDRRLSETEAAIAVAVGDLTAAELVRRLVVGSIKLDDGVTMAAGIDARAAIDGASTFAALVDYATSRRTKDAAALALWMILEELDRVRAPSLIASAIDGLSLPGSVVAPAVCEALATLERRSPGRLENVHAQSPRGRATIASAIARAYRAFGGMRDEG